MDSSQSSSATPTDLSFHLIERITNGFSEMLGRGGYGEVYKGMHEGKEIAVKKLYCQPGLDDEQFKNEFSNLMKVRHPHIVQLVGYCYEIRHRHVDHNGEYIFGKIIERALCFEYLQGSLEKHLYDESSGHDWQTRFKIIVGICQGLNYLHEGLKEPILHLDLKPSNILLDMNMVPKIADFGLSRLYGGTQTHITTSSWRGTITYMPPEYLSKHQISKKYDVFSLGVIIIQIMAGPEGYDRSGDMPSQEFIDLVHRNWKKRIEATPICVEEYSGQVRKCIEIAVNCVKAEKGERPTAGDIIHELNQVETLETTFNCVHADTGERPTTRDIIHASNQMETQETKIGPWGGDAGLVYELKVAPHRLEHVELWCGHVLDAIQFTYTDHNGKKHITDRWGGPGGGAVRVKLARSELVTEIYGEIGPYLSHLCIVRSLTLVTNVRSYGPFGTAEGPGARTPFRSSVQRNGSIVGFFVCAEQFVYAIGAYVKHNGHTTDLENEAV